MGLKCRVTQLSFDAGAQEDAPKATGTMQMTDKTAQMEMKERSIKQIEDVSWLIKWNIDYMTQK